MHFSALDDEHFLIPSKNKGARPWLKKTKEAKKLLFVFAFFFVELVFVSGLLYVKYAEEKALEKEIFLMKSALIQEEKKNTTSNKELDEINNEYKELQKRISEKNKHYNEIQLKKEEVSSIKETFEDTLQGILALISRPRSEIMQLEEEKKLAASESEKTKAQNQELTEQRDKLVEELKKIKADFES